VTDFRTTRQGQLQLRSEGLNRFLKAYDARVHSSILYPPLQQQLMYLRCIEMQVRQVAQVLRNQQAAYQPYTTR
jgi:CRISPR/Cas system-associated endonuclease Cas1